MTKKEAEEYFKAEIDDCPFKVFYCSAIANLYKKQEDNPGRILVIWSEECKSFSFFLTNHEVFVPDNFAEELEKLKKADNEKREIITGDIDNNIAWIEEQAKNKTWVFEEGFTEKRIAEDKAKEADNECDN